MVRSPSEWAMKPSARGEAREEPRSVGQPAAPSCLRGLLASSARAAMRWRGKVCCKAIKSIGCPPRSHSRTDMATSLKEQSLKRAPVYRNIHVSDLTSYRLPAAGWISILHRISGATLFLLLPFAIWLFDTSVTSEVSYEQFTTAFAAGAWIFPGWFLKLVAFGLIWAYLIHFCAGLRHLW